MSDYKVWVTWKSDQGVVMATRVAGLEDAAMVVDLRKAFVNQRRWQDRVDPATLTVSEREDGAKLKASKQLAEYFTTAPGSSDSPGRSEETALYVDVPNQQQMQQQQPKKTRIRKIDPPLPAAKKAKIEKGQTTKLPVQNLRILSPKMDESVFYYAREGTEELFEKLTTTKGNISITGHPGSGKSNLCWAVAHELSKKESVLWLSHVEFGQQWSARLFQPDGKGQGLVYELKGVSLDIREILVDPIVKDVTVLILDAPTKSKTETASDGLRAFEWAAAGKDRRVFHSSSLGNFSTDERVTSAHVLSNHEMRPWTRKDYIDGIHASEELKAKLYATMGLDASTSTEKAVSAKLHYAGINARWFFNFTIDEIKGACNSIVDRLGADFEEFGNSNARAVNSAYVSYRSKNESKPKITLYTSAYLALQLARDTSQCAKFFKYYPLLKERLGCGSPGEIFEADFLLHLEHSHALAQAQEYVLGKAAPEAFVRVGVDMSDDTEVLWPAGVIHKLDKNPSKDESALQPIPIKASDTDASTALWFDPIDNQQPFLDFFVLIPDGKTGLWKLRVLQNTISETHATDLRQLKRVVEGILFKGFRLVGEVVVAYIVERRDQTELGKTIDGSTLKVKVLSPGRSSRDSAADQEFTINVMRILYERTAAVPTP